MINDFVFENKPETKEFLSNNTFISGGVGAGKTVLLNQIIYDLLNNTNFEDYVLYVHDPKCVAFRIEANERVELFKNLNNIELVNKLRYEFEKRKILNAQDLSKQPNIVVISDEIGDDPQLLNFIKGVYEDSKKYKIIFITAAQLRDTYYRYQKMFDSGTVINIKGEYGDKSRTLEIVNK